MGKRDLLAPFQCGTYLSGASSVAEAEAEFRYFIKRLRGKTIIQGMFLQMKMKVLHLHKCLDISSRQALILDRHQNGLRERWQGQFTSEPPNGS